MKVLRGLGLEAELRRVAFQPPQGLNRVWDTGELTNALPLGNTIEERHGAPFLMMHRGDLHATLAAAVPAEIVDLDRKLVGLEPSQSTVTMQFADGSRATADA